MKLMAFSLGFATLTLSACSMASNGGGMDGLKEQVIAASPVEREIAASALFYNCGKHPFSESFVAYCEVCNVDLYADKDLPFNADPDTDAPIVGVKGWATHFYHEFEQDGVDGEPRIAVTGERASQKFETQDLSVPAITDLFADANGWCMGIGDGEFVLLRDDIEEFVEGVTS